MSTSAEYGRPSMRGGSFSEVGIGLGQLVGRAVIVRSRIACAADILLLGIFGICS